MGDLICTHCRRSNDLTCCDECQAVVRQRTALHGQVLAMGVIATARQNGMSEQALLQLLARVPHQL